MRSALVMLPLLTVGLTGVAGEVSLPSDAMATMEAYSSAITRGDCVSALRLVSPAVTRRLEAQPDGVKTFCDFLTELKEARVVEEIGPVSAQRAHGTFRIAVVPNLRTSLRLPTQPSYPTEGAYVLHSEDDGRTWYVLDLGCLDERWMKEVYPPYDGVPQVPVSRLRVPDAK